MANNTSYSFDFNRVASLEASQATLQNAHTQLLNTVNKFEHTVARLEREVNAERAERKKAEKELQRAHLAEKIAREALASFRSSHVMLQDPMRSEEKENPPKKEQPKASNDPAVDVPRDGYTQVENKYIQEMVKRLDELEKHKGMVEEQMRIWQKRSEDSNARLKDSNARNKEQTDDLREMHSDINKLHKKIGDLQDQLDCSDQKHGEILDAATRDAKAELTTTHADLRNHKDRINELEKELQQKTEKVSTANDGLTKAEKDKDKLQQEAKEWTEKTAYLTELSNVLHEDLKQSNKQLEIAVHERDELKLSLAEAEHTLADITAAEVATRDSYTLLEKEVQTNADLTNEDRASLERNFEDILGQMSELKKEVAMKNFTIARKEKRIRDLMIQEKDHDNADRATTTTQLGFFGGSPLADELDMTDFELNSDDEQSEPVLSGTPDELNDLQLSDVTGLSTAPVSGAPDVSLGQRRSRLTPDLLYAIVAFMLFLYLQVSSKLQAWEGANGVGFGEGYGGKFVYDGAYDSYN